MGVQDFGPSIQRESPTTQHIGDAQPHNFQDPEATCGVGPSDNTSPQSTQAMPKEVLRDANNVCDVENPLVCRDLGDNDAEPNRDLDQIMNEKDPTPEMVDDLDPMSAPPQPPSGPPTPDASQGGASDAQVCGGQCLSVSCIYTWILELHN